jgi:hypothetical protein
MFTPLGRREKHAVCGTSFLSLLTTVSTSLSKLFAFLWLPTDPARYRYPFDKHRLMIYGFMDSLGVMSLVRVLGKV